MLAAGLIEVLAVAVGAEGQGQDLDQGRVRSAGSGAVDAVVGEAFRILEVEVAFHNRRMHVVEGELVPMVILRKVDLVVGRQIVLRHEEGRWTVV